MADRRMALGGGNDAGLAGGATALVALTPEIDVVGLDDRHPAAFDWRAQLAAPSIHQEATQSVPVAGATGWRGRAAEWRDNADERT